MWQIDGYLNARDSRLYIEGVDALELSAQFGTPLFVFSEARILHNIHEIGEAFQHPTVKTKIFYASKANSNLALLQSIRKSGINVEVNSGGELYKALQAGFTAEQIIFNGVAKKTHEIAEAVEAGIFCINVDSAYELGRVIDAARQLHRRAQIALRMVPEAAATLHGGLATGSHSSKFGISELADVYREVLKHPHQLDLIGLHMHVGAQLTDAGQYGKAVRSLVTTALTQAEATGYRVRYLNLGGGLPVAYLKPDSEAEIAEQTRTMLNAGNSPQTMAQTVFAVLESIPGADVFRDLILEPGSRIIADTGVLFSTIENVKSRPSGDHWLLLDAGFNTLMDILGYNWYFHALAAGKISEDASVSYKLGGPLCDSGDVYHDSEGYDRLPEYRLLPAGMQPGDVIAFLDAGGYTLEQMNQYNGQPRAAAVLIRRNGQVQLIRKRESYADLLAHDLDLDD